MKRLIRFSLFAFLTTVVLVAIAVCALANMDPEHWHVVINGEPLQGGHWLLASAGLLLASMVLIIALLLVMLIGIGLPLLFVLISVVFVVLAVLGVSALVLSPALLVAAGIAWLWRASARSAKSPQSTTMSP